MVWGLRLIVPTINGKMFIHSSCICCCLGCTTVDRHLNYVGEGQTPLDIVLLLESKVKPIFQRKGCEFVMEHAGAGRNSRDAMPSSGKLYGGYRKRNLEDTALAPHSFTFAREAAARSFSFCNVFSCSQHV